MILFGKLCLYFGINLCDLFVVNCLIMSNFLIFNLYVVCYCGGGGIIKNYIVFDINKNVYNILNNG